MEDKYNIASLTDEEIQTLQVEQALRILGQIDQAFTALNAELFEANAAFYEAKKRLDSLKYIKTTLVERARNLKAIIQHA